MKQRLIPIRRVASKADIRLSNEQLIERLVVDLRPVRVTPRGALRVALAVAVLLVSALSAVALGPRADFWATTPALRVLFEIAIMGTLAVNSFVSLGNAAFPDADRRAPLRALLPATLMLLFGTSWELFYVRSAGWTVRIIGQNSGPCVAAIVLMGMPPLVAFFVALRRGAPASPGSAGMLAGVLSGAISATFYAIYSSEGSLLLFATCSSIAIGVLAVIGALAGRCLLKW